MAVCLLYGRISFAADKFVFFFVVDEVIAKNFFLQKQLFTILKQERDNAVTIKRLRTILEDVISELQLSEKKR